MLLEGYGVSVAGSAQGEGVCAWCVWLAGIHWLGCVVFEQENAVTLAMLLVGRVYCLGKAQVVLRCYLS